jgi:transcriptional regulator with XRE-family HTH domain
MKNFSSIPLRVKEMREILEISAEDVASKLGISDSEYAEIESGEKDIPISILYELAAILNVDFTTLLTGESPRMNTYSVVRGGNGAIVERYPGYDYTSLCYNFIGREMEPLLVRLTPENEAAPVTHTGQEFNYVLSGTVCVKIGGKEHILEAGDCIYFNPAIPHAQRAVGAPATFLTVIKE